MSRPDLRVELEREDELRRQRGLPPGSRARIWSRVNATVEQRSRGRRWLRPIALVPVAGLVALALVLWLQGGARNVAGFAVEQQSKDCALRVLADRIRIDEGQATLAAEDLGISFENQGPVVVRREDDGVRVLEGRAEFRVQHRPRGARPAVVFVSGGAIQVMGTKFTVDQRDERGSVTLHEGAIRFQPLKGEPVLIHPGETLQWPLQTPHDPEPARAPAPILPPPPQSTSTQPDARAKQVRPIRTRPAPNVASRNANPPDLEQVLHEIEVLRSRGEFEQAARQLETALREQPRGAREILSFELGSLLTNQLKDRNRACAQWARHQRAFRGGRYADEVDLARKRLHCDPPDERKP